MGSRNGKAARRPPDLRVGVSGWTYASWRKVFYPPGLPHRRELEYASRALNSIELNGSFYRLQRPSSYMAWREQTPPGFVFAVKGSRFITHMKKLSGVEQPLSNFLASGVLALEEKLGPFLWQFPEMVRFDRDRFARFLDLLPRDTHEAVGIAREHDQRAPGHPYLETGATRPIRHAFEVRHESFDCDEFFRLLENFGAAAVLADTAGHFCCLEALTADFCYVRLHGSTRLYASGYGDDELESWARRVRRWRAGGRDVYVYFDNDAKAHAPFDAMALATKLGISPAQRRVA